jgi:predicted ATP-grasp superfamily ATP-dependent carboligase
MFYSGVGIARAMAGRGVRVVGLSAHSNVFGNFTHLCEVWPAPDSAQDPEALASYLISRTSEIAGAVVFPTRDFDVLFLNRYRAMLAPHYRLAIPTERCLAQVVEKAALARTAECAGLSVPHTLKITSEEQVEEASKRIGYPCVVKPVSSVDWRGGDNWERAGSRKCFLVHTTAELRAEYRRVSAVHPDILVQEWIPGGVENIVVMGAYVGPGAKPLAYFTARKIIQSPADFGTGCLVRSEDIPGLLAPSRRLWQALNYEGMAEVEFKFDPRTGEYRLIEMNTRHWDQHELGCASGINVTWAAYCHLTGRPLSAICCSTKRALWIAEEELLSYVIRKPTRALSSLKPLFTSPFSRRICGIFSWRDPWAAFHYLAVSVLPTATRRVTGSLFRRKTHGTPS